jgi:RHS repeat-associated protein
MMQMVGCTPNRYPYNLRARRYDPASGRFSTRDSFLGYLNAPQTLHGYAYCGGDPVDYYDPSGNSFLSLITGQAVSIAQGQVENWSFNQSTASVRSGYNIVASEGGLVMGAAGVLGSFAAFVDGGLSATAAMTGITVGERLFSAGVEGVLRWIVNSHEVLSYKHATDKGKKIPNDQLNGPPPKRGRAPIGSDGKPLERHHLDQTPEGPKDEMTLNDHRGGDNYGKNHVNTGQQPSQIDRSAWKRENEKYWKDEWDSGRFNDM